MECAVELEPRTRVKVIEEKEHPIRGSRKGQSNCEAQRMAAPWSTQCGTWIHSSQESLAQSGCSHSASLFNCLIACDLALWYIWQGIVPVVWGSFPQSMAYRDCHGKEPGEGGKLHCLSPGL